MKTIEFCVALCFFAATNGRAIILLDTGDPSANTSAPSGALIDSGWQYQGDWGSFLGTPIAPNFFISAAHIGQAGSHLTFAGSSYTPIQAFSLPGSDLLIWRVRETFPYFAPLYSKNDELNKHLVAIGRGTQRDGEVTLDNTLRGWNWGAADHQRRWGENDVAEIVPYGGHDLLYATFDQHVLPDDKPNESHLSSGDSGGAVFINDSGAWKLTGINFAVDDLYTAPDKSTQFDAAIFDARGFYASDGNDPPTFTQITGGTPVPTGFYASRISAELPWICSVIADVQVGREENLLTITYWRLVAPSNEIVYTLEQSIDLVSWSTAMSQDQVVGSAGDLERVKASINPGPSPQLFARLRITRPSGAATVRPRANKRGAYMRPRALIP